MDFPARDRAQTQVEEGPLVAPLATPACQPLTRSAATLPDVRVNIFTTTTAVAIVRMSRAPLSRPRQGCQPVDEHRISGVEHGELRAADLATRRAARPRANEFLHRGRPMHGWSSARDPERARAPRRGAVPHHPLAHLPRCRQARLPAAGSRRMFPHGSTSSEDDETFRAEIAAAHKRPPRIGRVSFPKRGPGPASAARAAASSACTPTTRTIWEAATTSWGDGSPSGSSRCTRRSTSTASPRSTRARTHAGCWSSSRPPTQHRTDRAARDMIITRLGRGVDWTGRFEPEALARTIAVIERYCRRARALSAESIRVAATSATRDATNRERLADAVHRASGSELEVITGEQEAALSFLGATRGLDARDGPFLVVDIGGGSTESCSAGSRRSPSTRSACRWAPCG